MIFINTREGNVLVKSIHINPERKCALGVRYYYPEGIEKWVIDDKFPFFHKVRYYCSYSPCLGARRYYGTIKELFEKENGFLLQCYLKENHIYHRPSIVLYGSDNEVISEFSFETIDEVVEYFRNLSMHLDFRDFVDLSSKEVSNLSVLSYQEESLKSLIYGV